MIPENPALSTAAPLQLKHRDERRIPCQTPLAMAEVETAVRAPGLVPLFIQPRQGQLSRHAEFMAWFVRHKTTIDDLVVQYGAAVFRGFPLAKTSDFDEITGLYHAYKNGYMGGSTPRGKLGERALQSTTLDARFTIPIHSEMAYMRDYPPKLAFFSRLTASDGGATTICDMRRVTRKLPPSVVEKISRLGVRTVRHYGPCRDDNTIVTEDPNSVPWNRAFPAGARKEDVSALCEELGLTPLWLDDGSLTVISVVPGFNIHPATGERIFRTNIHSTGLTSAPQRTDTSSSRYSHTHSLGDGSHLAEEEIQAIRAIIDEETISWQWKDGDLLLVDNLLVGHGREPYCGDREQQVAMFC